MLRGLGICSGSCVLTVAADWCCIYTLLHMIQCGIVIVKITGIFLQVFLSSRRTCTTQPIVKTDSRLYTVLLAASSTSASGMFRHAGYTGQTKRNPYINFRILFDVVQKLNTELLITSNLVKSTK